MPNNKSSHQPTKKKQLDSQTKFSNGDKIAIISLIVAALTLIASIVVPEIRSGLGLEKKLTPTAVETSSLSKGTLETPTARASGFSTDLPMPTSMSLPTVSATEIATSVSSCTNYIDVRFFEASFLSKNAITTSSYDVNQLPSGEFLVVAAEFTSTQNQPVSFGWSSSLKIAGQLNNEWVYFSPNYSVTYDYAWEKLGTNDANCSLTINPGLWSKCYMVFD